MSTPQVICYIVRYCYGFQKEAESDKLVHPNVLYDQNTKHKDFRPSTHFSPLKVNNSPPTASQAIGTLTMQRLASLQYYIGPSHTTPLLWLVFISLCDQLHMPNERWCYVDNIVCHCSTYWLILKKQHWKDNIRNNDRNTLSSNIPDDSSYVHDIHVTVTFPYGITMLNIKK